MPRLINEPVGMPPRIAHSESKPCGMLMEPLEGFRLLKGFREWWASRCSNVDSAPGVMFAISRCCIHPKDFVQRNAPGQLPLDDGALMVHVTKAQISSRVTPSPVAASTNPCQAGRTDRLNRRWRPSVRTLADTRSVSSG